MNWNALSTSTSTLRDGPLAARALVVFLAALALSVCVACEPDEQADAADESDQTQSQQQGDEQAPPEQAADGFEPFDRIDAYADWMPAETLGVLVSNTSTLWELSGNFWPGDDETTKERVEALQADLSALMKERIGFDATATETVIMGGGEAWQVAILEGDFEASGAISFGDEEAKHFELPAELTSGALDGVWIVAVDEPRRAVIIFPDEKGANAAVEARAQDKGTLADSPKQEAFASLFEETTGDNFAVAIDLDEQYQQVIGADLPFPPPRGALLSLGDTISVRVQGDTQALNGMEALVEKFRKEAVNEIERMYEARGQEDTADAVGLISAYHMSMGYLETLESERADGSLNYRMSLPGGQGTLMLVGVGAAIAIPAFTKYIERSRRAAIAQPPALHQP